MTQEIVSTVIYRVIIERSALLPADMSMPDFESMLSDEGLIPGVYYIAQKEMTEP